MDERLFKHLAQWLVQQPVVLASVRDTRGATPRKRGSRMLISADEALLSVGGGEAEARVVAAAHELLARKGNQTTVEIDLGGGQGAAGVCGGRMQIQLRRWQGEVDHALAQTIAARLSAGETIAFDAVNPGAAGDEHLLPDPRLLIVGGGHCAQALYDLAQHLDFQLWVHDTRAGCITEDRYPDATRLCGDWQLLAGALNTQRPVYAVLLNRDYPSDVASLRALASRPPLFVAMMGSRRRISEVASALPEHRAFVDSILAPIGLPIQAQTPHEIAVSILAQLIEARARLQPGDPARY